MVERHVNNYAGIKPQLYCPYAWFDFERKLWTSITTLDTQPLYKFS